MDAPQNAATPSKVGLGVGLPVFLTISKESASQSVTTLHDSRKEKIRGRLYLGVLCWTFFVMGWNDGSLGPLLPVMQTYYHIGFTVVSLIFIFNFVGYMSGATLNMLLTERYGLGKVLFLASVIKVVGYIIMSFALPFPVMVMGYALIGAGQSLENALGNGLVGSFNTQVRSSRLGMLHGSYGVGAFASPWVATQFSHFPGRLWALHFVTALGLVLSNMAFQGVVLRGRTLPELLIAAGDEPEKTNIVENPENKVRQVLRLAQLHMLVVFTIIYTGVEVTLGGWIVTFIIDERNGGSTAGYISAGFFGGLALGRVVLLWVNRKVGEYRVLFIYIFLAIALEVTIWAVPSIIENAIAVSLIGVLLGPLFPLMISHTSRYLPQQLVVPSLGLITSIGCSGAALLPFATGAISSHYGIQSLQPFVVVMMCLMVTIWAFVPLVARRLDRISQ